MPLSVALPAVLRAVGAGVFALGVPAITDFFVERGRTTLGYFVYSAILVLTLSIAAKFIPWDDGNNLIRVVFIFFGVFPLINAIFDAVSYALTLSLVRYGLRCRKAIALVFAIIDLVCALALFALLGAALTFGIAGLSALASTDLFPLEPIFADLADGEVSVQNLWVVFMIFSTLVPTGLHLLLTLLSVQGLISNRIRKPVSNWIREGAEGSPCAIALALLGVPLITALPFVALYALCWAGWQVSADVIGTIGSAYLRWLEWIASAVGMIG